MFLCTQVVPSEPSQLKQLLRGPGIDSNSNGANIAPNNGTSPAGRRVTKELWLVLADKFGNTVVGAPGDRLQLLAEVLEAGDSERGTSPMSAGQGKIRPLDIPFFFCNDAARSKKVLLLLSTLSYTLRTFPPASPNPQKLYILN